MVVPNFMNEELSSIEQKGINAICTLNIPQNKWLEQARQHVLDDIQNITDDQIEILGSEIDDIQKITGNQTGILGNEIDETYVQWLECRSIGMPEKIIEYRKIWMSDLDITKKNKYKIVNAVGKIPHKYEICDDWSIITIMKIGKKTYKIIDINLKLHTDKKYLYPYSLLENNWEAVLDNLKTYVEETWMEWNFVWNWKNRELRRCIIEWEIRWYKIVDRDEMEELFNDLWNQTGIMRDDNKMAMLMYLTGMEGEYRLGIKNWSSIRNQILLGKKYRFFAPWYARYSWAGIFMLSCETN